MKMRLFNGSARQVSEIGLGTWQLGGSEWGDVSFDDAFAILEAAANEGVTFIDTADIYGMGRSESIIGQFLADRGDRSKFFIATKLGRWPEPGWPDNFNPDVVRRHVEASLERLAMKQIDLMQTHCIPHEVMKEGKVFDALRKLREEKLIAHFGASVETVEEALTCLNVEGLSSLQIIFNIFRQKPIDLLFEKAKAKKVALIARVPLASGLLSGKFKPTTTFAEADHRNFNRDGAKFNVGETFAGLPYDVGVDFATKLKLALPDGMTMAQFALRFCLDFDAITTVIPGATRPQQVKDNARTSRFPKLNKYTHDNLSGYYRNEIARHIRGAY